jgi:hypothetical protein
LPNKILLEVLNNQFGYAVPDQIVHLNVVKGTMKTSSSQSGNKVFEVLTFN